MKLSSGYVSLGMFPVIFGRVVLVIRAGEIAHEVGCAVGPGAACRLGHTVYERSEFRVAIVTISPFLFGETPSRARRDLAGREHVRGQHSHRDTDDGFEAFGWRYRGIAADCE